jgi:hypothetical protein
VANTTPAACPACHRPVNQPPETRRQRRCQCLKQRTPSKPLSGPVPLRPMLPVANAIAEALTMLDWNGKPDSISFPIHSASGMKLGDIVLQLLPHSYVSVGGQIAPVTAQAFLEALAESWSRPVKPKPDEASSPVAGTVVTLDADQAATPAADPEPIVRHRTPWDWEKP